MKREWVRARQLFQVGAMHHALANVPIFKGPMKLVGAAAEDDGNQPASSVPNFGRRTSGVNLNFFKRILCGGNLFVGTTNVANARLFSIDAIHRVSNRTSPLPQHVIAVNRLGARVIVSHANRSFLTYRNLQQLITGQDLPSGSGFSFQQQG